MSVFSRLCSKDLNVWLFFWLSNQYQSYFSGWWKAQLVITCSSVLRPRSYFRVTGTPEMSVDTCALFSHQALNCLSTNSVYMFITSMDLSIYAFHECGMCLRQMYVIATTTKNRKTILIFSDAVKQVRCWYATYWLSLLNIICSWKFPLTHLKGYYRLKREMSVISKVLNMNQLSIFYSCYSDIDDKWNTSHEQEPLAYGYKPGINWVFAVNNPAKW